MSVFHCVYLFINVYLPTKHIYDILTIFIGSHVEQVDNNEIQAGVLCKPVLILVVQWFLGGEERGAGAHIQKKTTMGTVNG